MLRACAHSSGPRARYRTTVGTTNPMSSRPMLGLLPGYGKARKYGVMHRREHRVDIGHGRAHGELGCDRSGVTRMVITGDRLCWEPPCPIPPEMSDPTIPQGRTCTQRFLQHCTLRHSQTMLYPACNSLQMHKAAYTLILVLYRYNRSPALDFSLYTQLMEVKPGKT